MIIRMRVCVGRWVKLIHHLVNLESIYVKSFKKVFKFKTTVTSPLKMIEKFLQEFLEIFIKKRFRFSEIFNGSLIDFANFV